LKIIVGLGNPGREYENTRHNTGFAVVDGLARKHRCRFTSRRCRSLVAKTRIGGVEVLLAKPLTFVNLSGEAVACILRMAEAELSDLLVVSDDVNIPFNEVRIRRRGGDGGHKGLQSIIAHVSSGEFPRLRVGVGSDDLPEDLTEFVLGTFAEEEMDELPNLVETCCRAVETLVVKGVERAMNEFNRKESDSSGGENCEAMR
jgi:PTH1 family peptidyl-tRNA hydrolase